MTVSRQVDEQPDGPRPPGRRAMRRQQTHHALVDAARRLRQEGTEPTVAQAAQVAGVPRATAYRYFPTQDSLRLELALTADVLAAEAVVSRPASADEVPDRVRELLTGFLSDVFSREQEYRSILRTYLDLSLAKGASMRPGRRMDWLEQALEPVRAELGEQRYERLRVALALLTGPDAAVVLRDVCDVEPDAALDVVAWAAGALVAAALAEASSEPRSPEESGDG